MSSRFLQVFVDNASFVVTGTVPFLQSRRADLTQALDVCTQYRRRGIARFLRTAQAEVLHHDLQRSGAAFASYLAWADDAAKITSRTAPFFDAVACGDMDAARAIATRSSITMKSDYEYEDDFLYARILMSRFCLGTERDTLDGLLARYGVLLDGAEDPRFVICQACVTGEADFFEPALERLIAARDEEYARGIEDDAIVEEDWATEGKIFVEGLALSRLGRALGFPLQKQYLFMPSIAMTMSAITFDSTSWTRP